MVLFFIYFCPYFDLIVISRQLWLRLCQNRQLEKVRSSYPQKKKWNTAHACWPSCMCVCVNTSTCDINVSLLNVSDWPSFVSSGIWMVRPTWRMWPTLWRRLKRKSSSLTGGELKCENWAMSKCENPEIITLRLYKWTQPGGIITKQVVNWLCGIFKYPSIHFLLPIQSFILIPWTEVKVSYAAKVATMIYHAQKWPTLKVPCGVYLEFMFTFSMTHQSPFCIGLTILTSA